MSLGGKAWSHTIYQIQCVLRIVYFFLLINNSYSSFEAPTLGLSRFTFSQGQLKLKKMFNVLNTIQFTSGDNRSTVYDLAS